MSNKTYALPEKGLPPQSQITADRSVFTQAYAVIPRGVMRDIVTSFFPGWTNTRGWTLARPLSGFAETFSQTIMEVGAGGGSEKPEIDIEAQSVIFVVDGQMELSVQRTTHKLRAGSYAYLPANTDWHVNNPNATPCTFHWIRKHYETVEGIAAPQSIVTHEDKIDAVAMPETDGAWATTRFVDSTDMAHDMHVNIVTFQPGGSIPFAETHVMEHGLYVLQGKAVYRLNQDWVEVEAGDFMWLRAFCPQACCAAGPEPFRYLLYKDVNRHPKLKV